MTGTGGEDAILVLNAGSSSIKCAVFGGDLTERLGGMADGIGGEGSLKVGEVRHKARFANHEEALAALLEGLAAQGLSVESFRAAGHRVVHGGTELTRPALVTDDVLAGIRRCVPLAPLQRAQAPLARAAAPPMMKNNKVVRIEVELEDGEPCAPPSPRPARVCAARGPPPGAQT